MGGVRPPTLSSLCPDLSTPPHEGPVTGVACWPGSHSDQQMVPEAGACWALADSKISWLRPSVPAPQVSPRCPPGPGLGRGVGAARGQPLPGDPLLWGQLGGS